MPDPCPDLVPAAQYIRMSTEHQRYSPEHQQTAIAAYAAENRFEVVRTYADEGISGLRLEKRAGLQALLADACSGLANYRAVLVYDVSRWGRFQDPDESAHYEFVCKQAGITVHYCAEPFTNDGALTSTLVKHLKRAMAAEYSRELSAKVSRAQAALAAKGFWQGGPPGYALRRRLVNPDGTLGPLLEPGQSKSRDTRVILVAGPDRELETVRRIFRLFVIGGLSRRTVARTLNRDAVLAEGGASWTPTRVAQVLTNEKYVAVQVFGKTRYFLRKRQGARPRANWIRARARFAPIVSQVMFESAQRNVAKRFRRLAPDQMIEGLQALYEAHGRLTSNLIRDAENLPCPEVYRRRFGGLLGAYARVGYQPGGRAIAAAKVVRRGQPCRRRDRIPDSATPSDLLAAVRAVYETAGRLSAQIIDDAPGAPSTDKLLKAFGSLPRVYELVGYAPTAKQLWTSSVMRRRTQISHAGARTPR